ncbi:MAG: CoA transferase [Clostridiales Family XIII bacterium]|jgi:crotonobetainyl-CoA:carnitine CoA-transferase CaiB-like acyl-CoA transferase|nr:CoA transferase [Clostridiales Family XIII bacterium]
MEKKALDGIKVVDFGWVFAGPYITMLLSFLGAEVIKIESRTRIDEMRLNSVKKYEDSANCDGSPLFNNINLNKKSVTLNLKSPQGIELAKKIVAKSDIVVENMRPGVMDKLGLGYDDLAKAKPDLIMLSSSGFGAGGPYGKYAGYAPIFASFGGLAYLMGYEDDEPNTGSGDMDLRAGAVAAVALLIALIHRNNTGEGQFIDLSSSDCISTLVGSELMEYSLNGRSPARCGNQDAVMAPHQVYRCKGDDKWVSIAVATEEEWEALRRVMGNPAWAAEKAYADAESRRKNRAELDQHISAWTRGYTAYEVMTLLQNAGVAAMPSFSSEELLSDPHTLARGNVIELAHPVMGTKNVISPPWKLSETPAKVWERSPLMGEHNEECFCGLLGMSKEELEKLEDEQIIY